MAGATGSPIFPHGEYLALSQFQGFESHSSALATEHYFDGRAYLPSVELLAAGSAGAGYQLRWRWDRDSNRRHREAASAPATADAPGAGASSWLRRRGRGGGHEWVAFPCWLRKSASCWNNRNRRRMSS